MIELAATTVITASSTLLFAYWYRYTCLLILSAKTTKDYTAEVAAANQLKFVEVQAQLRQGLGADLERLHQSLDRDYALLTYLFRNASGAPGEHRLEDRMLQLDYRLMGLWFKTCRRFSLRYARPALEEMSLVVAHFANAVGERAACATSA
jgi:hypothetical protein